MKFFYTEYERRAEVVSFCLYAALGVFVLLGLWECASKPPDKPEVVEQPAAVTQKKTKLVLVPVITYPTRLRFYTMNYLYEGATVVVRDHNRRTARASFPETFKKDRRWYGASVPDLPIPVKGLDLGGVYDIVIHFKSGAVSRFRFNSLPDEEEAAFYLHVCGPGETLYAAVYLNGVHDGHRYPVGVKEKLY